MEENKKELYKAMSEAFPEIEGAIKDKENPHFRSKYADLGNVVDAIKPALVKHGLFFVQNILPTPGYASVETIILHSSGSGLSCGVTSVPLTKNDAQGYGSALTYARRYSLSAAFGVAPEDDDGNEACKTSNKKQEVPKLEPVEKSQPPLSLGEIEALAKRVAEELMEDPDLQCVIYSNEMAEYLCHWQTAQSLQPKIDQLLMSNRKALLNSFARWQAKKTPKAA